MNLFKFVRNINTKPNKRFPFMAPNNLPPNDKIFWSGTLITLVSYWYITHRDKYEEYTEKLEQSPPPPPP